MSGLYTVVFAVCAASVICSLLSGFVTDGSLKRVLNLVMGAFLVCSMMIPVSKAVMEFRPETDGLSSYEELTATADGAVGAEVVARTRENLENTLTAFLEQNGVAPRGCEIILAETENQSIIISRISIYIDRNDSPRTELIAELTKQHFGIVPRVVTE